LKKRQAEQQDVSVHIQCVMPAEKISIEFPIKNLFTRKKNPASPQIIHNLSTELDEPAVKMQFDVIAA